MGLPDRVGTRAGQPTMRALSILTDRALWKLLRFQERMKLAAALRGARDAQERHGGWASGAFVWLAAWLLVAGALRPSAQAQGVMEIPPVPTLADEVPHSLWSS